jgi:hypothetical protein
MAEQRWHRTASWVGAEFEESLVMVEIELGTYVGLKGTAAAVWEAIERPATQDEIVGHLRSRFEVPADQCESAVAVTLERFREIGLATPIDAA